MRQNFDRPLQTADEIVEPSGDLVQYGSRTRRKANSRLPRRRHGTTLKRLPKRGFPKDVTHHRNCDTTRCFVQKVDVSKKVGILRQ